MAPTSHPTAAPSVPSIGAAPGVEEGGEDQGGIGHLSARGVAWTQNNSLYLLMGAGSAVLLCLVWAGVHLAWKRKIRSSGSASGGSGLVSATCSESGNSYSNAGIYCKAELTAEECEFGFEDIYEKEGSNSNSNSCSSNSIFQDLEFGSSNPLAQEHEEEDGEEVEGEQGGESERRTINKERRSKASGHYKGSRKRVHVGKQSKRTAGQKSEKEEKTRDDTLSM